MLGENNCPILNQPASLALLINTKTYALWINSNWHSSRAHGFLVAVFYQLFGLCSGIHAACSSKNASDLISALSNKMKMFVWINIFLPAADQPAEWFHYRMSMTGKIPQFSVIQPIVDSSLVLPLNTCICASTRLGRWDSTLRTAERLIDVHRRTLNTTSELHRFCCLRQCVLTKQSYPAAPERYTRLTVSTHKHRVRAKKKIKLRFIEMRALFGPW